MPLRHAYDEIARAVPQLKIMPWRAILATWAAIATRRWRCPSPDCTSICPPPEQLDDLANLAKDRVLSLGVNRLAQ